MSTYVSVLLCVLVLLGCFVTGEVAGLMMAESRPATVRRVIDGDTVELKTGEVVRYIGVDTPELAEYYGEEATGFNRKLVEGKPVKLEFDIEKEETIPGRPSRTLAYVYMGDIFLNAEMIKRGYARAYTVKPNTKHAKLFLELEAEARRAERGMWSKDARLKLLEELVRQLLLKIERLTQRVEELERRIGEDGRILPSENSGKSEYIAAKSGEVLHLPLCPHARRIKEENKLYFRTFKEAVDSGRRPCRTCKPVELENTSE